MSTLTTAALTSLGLIAVWLSANLAWLLLALYRNRRESAQGRRRDQSKEVPGRSAATVIYPQWTKDLRTQLGSTHGIKVVESPAALGGD